MPAIRDNAGVGLRIAGAAQSIPLKSESLDAVVCFYSVHHMVGSTISETKRNVMAALGQFHRLLKPGGDLWIFDLAPVPPASFIERLCWNLLRSVLGNGLDMYFGTMNGLVRLAGEDMPNARM